MEASNAATFGALADRLFHLPVGEEKWTGGFVATRKVDAGTCSTGSKASARKVGALILGLLGCYPAPSGRDPSQESTLIPVFTAPEINELHSLCGRGGNVFPSQRTRASLASLKERGTHQATLETQREYPSLPFRPAPLRPSSLAERNHGYWSCRPGRARECHEFHR